MVRRGEQSLILFLFGGVGYSLLEILWRGFTHWTMFVLGGICFVLLSRLSVNCCGRVPMWACCFGSAVLITSLEFLTGCVVNLGLGWNVWSYSDQPLNLLGQICLGFSALWFLLSVPLLELSFWLCRRLDGGYRIE